MSVALMQCTSICAPGTTAINFKQKQGHGNIKFPNGQTFEMNGYSLLANGQPGFSLFSEIKENTAFLLAQSCIHAFPQKCIPLETLPVRTSGPISSSIINRCERKANLWGKGVLSLDSQFKLRYRRWKKVKGLQCVVQSDGLQEWQL